MPPLSVHQEILELSVARIEALSLGGMETRVIRRMVKAGSWQTGAPSGDFIVVSGWGQLRSVGNDDTCSLNMGYPLSVAAVYRTTKEWNPAEEDAQLAVSQKLMDAFLDKPLVLTFNPGSGVVSCDNILLVSGTTLQSLDEMLQQIMRELLFEVQVNQLRV